MMFLGDFWEESGGSKTSQMPVGCMGKFRHMNQQRIPMEAVPPGTNSQEIQLQCLLFLNGLFFM